MQLTVRIFTLFIFTCCFSATYAQNVVFSDHTGQTVIARLTSGDSVIYYQCHVDEASQQLLTSSGQTITTKAKKLTITEKIVILRRENIYHARYYVSGVNDYPNKKFPYLTIKEVANWNFELKNESDLSAEEVLKLAAFETKTHDIVHYELKVNKSCPNEVVIVHGKDRTQLMIEGNYLLSREIKGLIQ